MLLLYKEAKNESISDDDGGSLLSVQEGYNLSACVWDLHNEHVNGVNRARVNANYEWCGDEAFKIVYYIANLKFIIFVHFLSYTLLYSLFHFFHSFYI